MLGDQLKLGQVGGERVEHQVLDTDVDARLDLATAQPITWQPRIPGDIAIVGLYSSAKDCS